MIETLSVSFACHVEHVQNRFLHKLSCRAYVLTWFASVFISYVYVYYFIFWKQFLLFDRLLRFSFQTLLLYWFPCWISLKNFVRSEISSANFWDTYCFSTPKLRTIFRCGRSWVANSRGKVRSSRKFGAKSREKILSTYYSEV